MKTFLVTDEFYAALLHTRMFPELQARQVLHTVTPWNIELLHILVSLCNEYYTQPLGATVFAVDPFCMHSHPDL